MAIRVSGGGVTFGRLVEAGSWFVLVTGGGAVVKKVMLIWRWLTINVREGTAGIWFCIEWCRVVELIEWHWSCGGCVVVWTA